MEVQFRIQNGKLQAETTKCWMRRAQDQLAVIQYTREKSLKRAKKSEVNFLPDIPEGQTNLSLEEVRTAMISEIRKRKVDWKQIQAMMTQTFSLRRKEIVDDEPPVAEIKARWPALFYERQVKCLSISNKLKKNRLGTD